MSDHLSCLACGDTSFDVKMTLIELPDAEQRPVNVPIVVHEQHGRQPEVAYIEVPERYIREPRCRDRVACKERLAAIELAALAAMPEPAWTI